MNVISEYRIRIFCDFKYGEESINEFIAEGWQPFSTPFLIPNPLGDSWGQVLVKYIELPRLYTDYEKELKETQKSWWKRLFSGYWGVN